MLKVVRIGTFLGALAAVAVMLLDFDASRDLRGAQAFLARHDLDMALRLASRALLLHQLSPEGQCQARRVRVLAARQLKADGFATRELARMQQECASQPQSRLMLGELLLEQQKYAEALDHLEQGLALAAQSGGMGPALALPLAQRGLARLALGQVDQAEQDADLALRLRPRLAEGHYLLSQVAWEKGRLDLALEEMETAWGLAAAGRRFFFMEPRGKLWLERLITLRMQNKVDPRRPLRTE